MTYPNDLHARAFLLATRLALVCTTAAATGCGGDDGASTPEVDSDLPGIYVVDLFQSSPDCGELTDAEGAPRLVLYSALRADSEEPILVGQFCGSVEDCRSRAEQGAPAVNYSFFDGSDAQGWEGYGIADQGMAGDQCRVELQVHMLTSSSGQSIQIDTEEVEVVYPPSYEDDVATCTIRDAINWLDEDSPCTALFLLEATFEAGL